jgi:sugar lactone lactonase YvrE
MNCFITWFRARGRALLLGTVWILVFCASLAAQDLSFTGLQSTLSVTGLPEPNGIAIDASGNRYLVDQTLSNVIEVSAAGSQTTILSTLNGPTAIAVDSAGNLYVADTGNARVLKISAGGGTQVAVGSGFIAPSGVAVDSLGNLYVADPGATPAAVWEVAVGGGSPTRVAQASLSNPVAVATDGANNLYILDSGDGEVVKVSAGGSPSFAINRLHSPTAIAVDAMGGSLFVVSNGSHTLYRFAASGEIQQLGTALGSPTGVAVDSAGRALVTDLAGSKVDVIAPGAVDLGQANLCPSAQPAPCSQQVVLNFIVGNQAGLSSVDAQAVTQGSANLDFNATANTCTGTLNFGHTCSITVVFKPLAPGTRLGAVDVVGIVSPDLASRPGPHPRLTVPTGGGSLATVFLHGVGVAPQLGFDAALINNLPFVLQAHNAGGVPGGGVHPKGGGGPQPTNNLQGLTATSNGDVYVIDSLQCIVDKFTAATSLTSRVAGSGCSASAGDGGPATSAVFRNGSQVAVNGRGDIYIPDLSGSAIRKVDALTGIITTVAGILNSYGYTAGPVVATTATLSAPASMAVDDAGNFYWTDNAEYMVRKVDVSTGILTTVAGSHVAPGYSGDGGPATSAALGPLGGIALDGSGNLYIADSSNNVVREVSPAPGIITTIAGTGPATCSYGGDHGPATRALLCGPLAVAVDAAGNVYFDDAGNGVVRKVNASSGDITTAAGLYSANPPTTYTGNGGPATLASLVDLVGVTLDGAGNLYVTDGQSNVIRKITGAMGIANFATFNVADSSPAQDITVSNNGNAILDLSGLVSSINFNLSGADTSCGISTPLNTGGSCVLGIEFLPTVIGDLTGSVTLTDNVSNDPTSTQSVSLTGTGIAQVATQLALAGVPATLLAGGNLGTATVNIEAANGSIVTSATAAVTLTIAGPNGYSQVVMATAVSGTATFNLISFALPTAGTYTVTASSAALTAASATAVVTAAPVGPTKLALAGVPATVVAGANLGTATVSTERANGSVVTGSSATVTLTISGPGGFSQAVMATAASGLATFNLASLALPIAGTYTVTATSAGLTAASVTVVVTAAVAPQDFTLNFTAGTTVSSTQTVVPGSVAVFPFTLAPATGNFVGVITLSATSPLAGATYSFSPPTVTPGSNGAQTTMTVQTVKPLANLQHRGFSKGYETLVFGLLLLPFAGSRKGRRVAQQSPMRVLAFALLSLGIACAATGCGAGGLFSNPSNTYIVTVTGTSGTLSHSTTVTLIEE